LRERIERSGDPLETAVRLAIAGNIIDFAVLDPVSGVKVIEETISRALDVPLEGHMENFREAVGSAERILYLTDNAGEIAFDRLLAEQIGTSGMTIAVRGAPVINDATIDDARACGLSDIFDVVDNGADVPGTLLDLCSNEFRETFSTADMIIAKGMGNYESLSDVDSNIYFLLKVKCRVIANDIGFDEGSMVVFNSG
jgi:damage-control phosphatase, subfamily I